MIDDEKLAYDESRRLSDHEAIKSSVRNDVHNEIARSAEARTPDPAQVDHVAGRLKEKAVYEVAETENELDRARTVARVSQVIDYIFCLIYGIIGLEIILEMMGARDNSGFKQFLDTIAMPLVAPFRGLLPNPEIGRFSFMLSYIVGIVIYILLHLAINGALRLLIHKKTAV